eukprot:comp22843_c1_seq1/m.35990 comp22843_c1_seq1/g.35990  ORF comp22843_c1_seq1/g.35990 comp22843_c1_seq1/m.35990 type:complete len:321 (-) comp22843_c1_seq1:366-1328(-)
MTPTAATDDVAGCGPAILLKPPSENGLSVPAASTGAKDVGMMRSSSYNTGIDEDETNLKNTKSITSLCSMNMGRDGDFKQGTTEGETNCWSEPDATKFEIRGKNYLKDGLKVSSEPAVGELVDVDIFRTTIPGRFDNFSSTQQSYVQWALSQGETRFMVVVHFQSLTYNMACTWALDNDRLKETSPGFQRSWKKFLEGDDDFRNQHFKVIPRVVDAHWLLKAACGSSKPILFATKLTHRYNITDKYMEIMCDTTSSTLANKLADMSISYASTLTFDMAMEIEGRTPEELPERIWGIFRMTKPDLKRARKVALPKTLAAEK